MAQIPNLDNSPLNLKSLREQSQRDLVKILKDIRGKKCLVIEPKLGGSLSLIIQTSLLKEYGIELRHLSAEPVQTDFTKVVYLIPSQRDLMKFISSHVHSDISKGLQREYYIYFVPRREIQCERILEEEKVHHLITIGEYPLYVVPLDEDILSFELDLAYKECQVDGDTGSLWHIAKAIHKLESSFGVIPNVRAKGKASVLVTDILNRMQTEEPVNSSDMAVPEINTLILIDREVDMVTPMCSQLTYEGLLDEFLRIHNGSVELDSSIMGVQQEGKKIKVPLNSSCFEYIEEMIQKQESLINVLRLLILFSVTNSGLPKKHFDYLRRELLHSYGFEHMATLNNLEKAGLFKRQESKSNWLTVKRALQLVVEDTDTANPNDIAYVFSGYAPLSIRLVQHAVRSGWRPMEEILKLLPGPHTETKRGGFTSSQSFDALQGASSGLDKIADGRRSLVLVVFVGGVTFAEISALRFLSAQEGMAYDLIIGTTKIINGHSLVETFFESFG
ncbi:vacuolar protein-sorting-associated protein 33 homolog isoform X4 [Durio zibethinus]|uniref:Vacuolar protein-sorting-associated protein 33 homolog isoform X4 n=1 Tax=Durio zibethinus TaxID=66656 RepID=A0A6P6AKT0_DURZI|nr:vacuolar protein-sorting-associated protein 33 homolog isoform X4 [Durio zibethinus]